MEAVGARILSGQYAFLGEGEDGRPNYALVADSDLGRRNRQGQGDPSRGQLRRDDRGDRKDQRQVERQSPHYAPQANAPRLIPQEPNVSQVKIFAHGVLTVLTTAAINFSVQALVPFRPTRGILSATVSLNTTQLTDIKVANRSQIASSSVFPGQMFNSAAQEVYIDLDVISAAIPFQVLGTNADAATQVFILGWYGNLFEVANI